MDHIKRYVIPPMLTDINIGQLTRNECRWAAAAIMEIAYGHRVNSIEDKFIEHAERTTVETVKAGSPGSMLVDFFPICEPIYFFESSER